MKRKYFYDRKKYYGRKASHGRPVTELDEVRVFTLAQQGFTPRQIWHLTGVLPTHVERLISP